MKKKHLVATALLSCSALLFTGCGPTTVAKMDASAAVYQDYKSEATLFTTATEITDLTGFEYQYMSGLGDFLAFSKQDTENKQLTYAVMNKNTGAIKKFGPISYTDYPSDATTQYDAKSLYGIMGGYYSHPGLKTILVVVKTDSANTPVVTTTTLYDKDFNQIAEVAGTLYSDEYDIQYNNYDTPLSFKVGGKIYYYDRNGDAVTFSESDKYKPADYQALEDGGYIIKDSSAYKLLSYDKDGNLIHTYNYPGNASFVKLIPFEDGNYLLQYIVTVDPLEKKYDFLAEGTVKYDMTTVLVDVANDKVKELDFNFYIGNANFVTPNSEEGKKYVWEEGVVALITNKVYELQDKIPVAQSGYYTIDAEGNIKNPASVAKDIDIVNATKTASGNFIGTDSLDKYYLIGADGAIISEINMDYFANADGTNKYYRAYSEFYNGDFQKITIPEGYSFYKYLSHEVVLIKTEIVDTVPVTSYYLLNNGTPTLIGKQGDVTFADNGAYYEVKTVDATTSTTTYTYYNGDGKAIGTAFEYRLSYIGANAKGDVAYMYGTDSTGATHFFKAN